MVVKKKSTGVRRSKSVNANNDNLVEEVDDAGNKLVMWAAVALVVIVCLFAIYFLFSGPAIPETSEIIEKFSEASKNVDSGSAKMVMEMTMGGAGSPIPVTVVADADIAVDYPNQKMYTMTTTKVEGIPLGEDQTSRGYIMGDTTYTEIVDAYTGETIWVKQVLEENMWEGLREQLDLSGIVEYTGDVTIETKDDKQTYRIPIDPDIDTLLKSLIESQMGDVSALGLTQADVDEMTSLVLDSVEEFDAVVWIDTETYLLIAMEADIMIDLDLADLLGGDAGLFGADSRISLNLDLEGEFDYENAVNIELPDEAKNAIDIEDYYNPVIESVCGDGWCDLDEDDKNCPEDCETVCGDKWCDWGEDSNSCPQDCFCGDYWCDDAEDEISCPEDCVFDLPLPEEDADDKPVEAICIDRCGDGECAEIVCLGSGCPCAETEKTCPEDCSSEDRIIG